MFSFFKTKSKVPTLDIDDYDSNLSLISCLFGPSPWVLPSKVGITQHDDADYFVDIEELNVCVPSGKFDIVMDTPVNYEHTLLYHYSMLFNSIVSHGRTSITFNAIVPDNFNGKLMFLLSLSDKIIDAEIDGFDFEVRFQKESKSMQVNNEIEYKVTEQFKDCCIDCDFKFDFNQYKSEYNEKEITLCSQAEFDEFCNSDEQYDYDAIHLLLDFDTLSLKCDNCYSSISTIGRSNGGKLTINLLPDYGYSSHPDVGKANVFNSNMLTPKLSNVGKVVCDQLVEFEIFDLEEYEKIWGNPSLASKVRKYNYDSDNSSTLNRRAAKLYSPLEVERLKRIEAEAKILIIKENVNKEIGNLQSQLEHLLVKHKAVLRELESIEYSFNSFKDLCFIAAVDLGQSDNTKSLQYDTAVEVLSVLCPIKTSEFGVLISCLEKNMETPPSIKDVIKKINNMDDLNMLKRANVMVDALSEINDDAESRLKPVVNTISTLQDVF